MLNQAIVHNTPCKLFIYGDLMTFGEWLREKINDKHISNAELARLADCSSTYIGNLVRDYSPNTKDGKARPSREMTIRIAKALDENVDDALRLAMHAPLNNDVTDTLEVGDGVEVRFQEFVPETEREEIRKAARLIVAGIRAENEKKK